MQFSKTKGRGQNRLCLFCYRVPNEEVNENVWEGLLDCGVHVQVIAQR
jgi:hypothetical protein